VTYKELAETNTTLSSGAYTLAAGRKAARLKVAGYPDEDVRVFVLEGHWKEGGLPAGMSATDVRSKDPARDASVARVDTKFTHTSYNEFRD
jgi:hypothetical protein